MAAIQHDASDNSRRIGLFGGTFDPIHNGHLNAAREVRRRFRLHTVWFVPAAVPPHKPTGGMAGPEHRLEMIRLAIANDRGLRVSDVELRRSGPSYTVDTVRHFNRTLPEDTELFFLMGIDAFLEIDTWKSYRELFRMIRFVVMARPGAAPCCDAQDRARIGTFVSARIGPGYRYEPGEGCFVHPDKRPVFLCAVRPVDVSSTRVRDHIRSGLAVPDLVPEPVEAYIAKQGLYR